MQALLLKNPLEEAANASDHEINAIRKTVMSEHAKNLFIEQRKRLPELTGKRPTEGEGLRFQSVRCLARRQKTDVRPPGDHTP